MSAIVKTLFQSKTRNNDPEYKKQADNSKRHQPQQNKEQQQGGRLRRDVFVSKKEGDASTPVQSMLLRLMARNGSFMGPSSESSGAVSNVIDQTNHSWNIVRVPFSFFSESLSHRDSRSTSLCSLFQSRIITPLCCLHVLWRPLTSS